MSVNVCKSTQCLLTCVSPHSVCRPYTVWTSFPLSSQVHTAIVIQPHCIQQLGANEVCYSRMSLRLVCIIGEFILFCSDKIMTIVPGLSPAPEVSLQVVVTRIKLSIANEGSLLSDYLLIKESSCSVSVGLT